MSAFDVSFNFLLETAKNTMRMSQMELDSINLLLGDTCENHDFVDLDLFVQSISDEQTFWKSWIASKSPVRKGNSKRIFQNPFQDLNSNLNTKKSSLTLSELKILVGSCQETKNERKNQIREWLKSQR